MSVSSVSIDYSELRGLIKTKLGNEGKFAEAIGRSHTYVSKVFNGKSFFDVKDIINACEVLSIPIELVGFFFYTH